MENSLKSGVCPKCGGNEVYYTEREIHKILPHEFENKIGLGFLGRRPSPTSDNFVCGKCGYAEFFVRPLGLETVKRDWDRWEPR